LGGPRRLRIEYPKLLKCHAINKLGNTKVKQTNRNNPDYEKSILLKVIVGTREIF
jgi:hypothetical protein